MNKEISKGNIHFIAFIRFDPQLHTDKSKRIFQVRDPKGLFQQPPLRSGELTYRVKG